MLPVVVGISSCPRYAGCLEALTLCCRARAESGGEGQPLVAAAPASQSEQDRAIEAEALAILADGSTDKQPQLPLLKLGLLVLMFAGARACLSSAPSAAVFLSDSAWCMPLHHTLGCGGSRRCLGHDMLHPQRPAARSDNASWVPGTDKGAEQPGLGAYLMFSAERPVPWVDPQVWSRRTSPKSGRAAAAGSTGPSSCP